MVARTVLFGFALLLLAAGLLLLGGLTAGENAAIAAFEQTPTLTIPPPGPSRTPTVTLSDRSFAPLVLDMASTPTVYLTPTCSPTNTPPPPAPGTDGSNLLLEVMPACGLGPTVTLGASPTSGPTNTPPPP
jgi:hypothetical protein